MAKFNLRAAKAAAQSDTDNITPGYHRVVIVQVANVGEQKGWDKGDDGKESIGFTFELAGGAQIAKVVPVSFGAYAHLTAISGATDDPEYLEDYLGQQFVIEVESAGQWPKLAGFYHLEDGLVDDAEIKGHAELLHFDVGEPDTAVLKKLHKTLRTAYAGRVRKKVGGDA